MTKFTYGKSVSRKFAVGVMSIAMAASSLAITTAPAQAAGEFAELKINAIQCAVLLARDIANGTSIHAEECGTGGTATSNYGGHTTGASKSDECHCWCEPMTGRFASK